MKRLLICCLFFLLLSSQQVLADEFIVTSPLSQGAGTLRDALEQAAANGNRTRDTIKFNITRATPVIIRIPINNLLPAITGNLVIDGTTQPGSKLGVSDAKLCVTIEGFYSGNNLIYLFDARTANDVEIYGLFIKGNVGNPVSGVRPQFFYGIMLQGSQRIRIGRPGKGNIISGWTKGIFDEYEERLGKSNNISISSNIFGLETDGVSTRFNDAVRGPADNTFSIEFKGNSSCLIGGNDPTEGNLFNSANTDITVSGVLENDGVATISHNKFGIDINGDNITSSTLTPNVAAINAFNINSMPLGINILANPVITNNYIGGTSRITGIWGKRLEMPVSIIDNIIGYEDRSGNPDRNTIYGRAIWLTGSFLGNIRNNIIRYWKQGAIILDNTYSILITQNSTYCNKKRAIELNNWAPLTATPSRAQPYAYINRIDPFRGVVAGTSLPNYKIELFYNENCATCEGKTLLATLTADANGNWAYNGPLTGDNVIATATDLFLATSEYTMPKIDTSALSVTPVACAGGVGSICGLRILSGTKWRWEDATGNIVGYDTCLRGVPAGRYYMKLAVGSSCEETFSFVVPDVTPTIDITGLSITAARCNAPNGSICGLRVRNGVSWRWEDAAGNIQSTNLCFNTASPGRYRLRLEGQQNCIVYSPLFDVPNKSPAIDASNAVVVHPSCGKDNGSITGIQLTNMEFSTAAWYNDLGVFISAATDIRNLPPGRYKLVVKDNSGICGDSTNYFSLNIVPPPVLNVAAAQVNDASCGRNNGSITGITFSNTVGTVNFWWTDQTGRVVATATDLLNVAPGNYRLKLKDGSNCDTLYSPVYTITDKGSVTLDSSSVVVSATGCNKITGAILGLKITGATNLEWRNVTTGLVVGNSADLSSMPAGSYQLTAFNSTYSCTTRSRIYVIPLAPAMNIQVLEDSTKHATCGGNNGSIRLTQLSSNTSWFSFRWLKDSTTVIGTGLSVSNLSPATYYCIATDSNGCELPIFKKTITALQLPVLNESNATINADTCQFKTGRITGLLATSDASGIQYVWYNIAGQEVGRTQQLINMGAGDYYLQITDARGCTARSRNYTIPAVSTALPAPRYTSLINIARNSDARLSPLDSRTATYQLYDRITGTLIAQNTTGTFILQAVPADRELYVIYSTGPCSSAQVNISIKVFDDTRLTIPNAFSPNNDGINDEFRIQVLGYFKLNSLKIFNRWGQMVHEVRDLNLPWDGKRNGNPLPVGTYYWILDGIDMHNKRMNRAGSITLIR